MEPRAKNYVDFRLFVATESNGVESNPDEYRFFWTQSLSLDNCIIAVSKDLITT